MFTSGERLLETLDAACGYDACGAREFFDALHLLPLERWAAWLDRDVSDPGEPPAAGSTLERALLTAHPWAVWRARDQVEAELHRFERHGRGLLRRAEDRTRLARLTERAALAAIAGAGPSAR